MVHLHATDGHSYINGSIISKDVYTPNEEEASKWILITDVEATKIEEGNRKKAAIILESGRFDETSNEIMN